MCVGFWFLHHPEYALVLCTNRDEYLARPTEPAHWHSFESLDLPENVKARVADRGNGSVLSGVDTLAGGTWFGISKTGDVALLTNITEPTAALTSSRGYLCASFLLRMRSSTLSQFVEELTAEDTRYAGFNILLLSPRAGDGSKTRELRYDAAFLSNRGAGGAIMPVPLVDGSGACGGISNGVPGGVDPFTGLRAVEEWGKVVQGRELLANALAESEGEEALIEGLFGLLRTKFSSPPRTRQDFQKSILIEPVDLADLRRGPSFVRTNEAQISNVFQEQEPRLSDAAPHADPPKYYATRLSSVLLVRTDGEVLFVERDVWLAGPDGKPVMAGQQAYRERRFRSRIG